MNLPTIIESHPCIDLSNPQHFINLVPPNIRSAILEIPIEWFDWGEKKLMVQVFGGQFPENDYELRLSFWEEYERCFEECKKMVAKNIYGGIISQQVFSKEFLGNPGRVLFMITEPSYYKKCQKYIHHLLLNRVADIAKSDILHDAKTGLPDTKMMDLQLKAYQYLDARIYGSLIQKHQVEQRTQSLNVNINATEKSIPAPSNIDDIDKRIAEMERELSTEKLPPAVEVVSPLDSVHKEVGRVVDAEFVNLHSNRDNSHREPPNQD